MRAYGPTPSCRRERGVTPRTPADISRAVAPFGEHGGTSLGGEARFEALYRAHYRRVLSYALRRAAPDVAADVVADTFLVAWRRLDRVPDEPLPWLLAVARKTLANERRGARRRGSLLSALAARHAAQASAIADEPFPASTVLEALARLPPDDQELVKLVAWDDLSIVQAAAVLARSAATCRVRLHRARRRLASELARRSDVRAPRPCHPLTEETQP